ncbi:MAG: hypothetical protein IMZ58_01225 [Thermoplasmata archaeon]|nr:hypothetical protein [Thermoplasmata archaeon]
MKHWCKCGKKVEDGNSTYTCNDCTTLNKTRGIIRVYRRNEFEEIHFAFHDNAGMYATNLGAYIILKKDIKKTAIWIYLFNFKCFYGDDSKIKNLIISLSHEWMHELCYLTNDYDAELTKKQDSSGLLKKLELEGYLGGYLGFQA